MSMFDKPIERKGVLGDGVGRPEKVGGDDHDASNYGQILVLHLAP